MLIVAPIAGAFAKRTSPLVPLVAATVLGIVTFAALAGHHDQQWQLYLGSAAWGTTVALGLVATFLLVVEAVPLADAGSAASMTTLGQAVGSAIGTAVFTAALTSELVPGTPVPAAGGYTRAFVAAALFAAAALVCSLVTVAVTRARPAPRRRALREIVGDAAHGVRVVDSSDRFGLCARYLADLGADVVRAGADALAGADIWIETSRPGTHDIDAIRAAHPELVVVPITDFGQTRPYRD